MTIKKIRQTANGKKIALTLSETIANNFSLIPAKLVAQARKDLTLLKQYEKKCQNELKKASAQKLTAKKQHSKLIKPAKTKMTASQKKQLSIAKLTMDHATKTILALSSTQTQIKQQLKSLTNMQNKFTALSKQLIAFEKKWEKQTKKTLKTAKPS